MILLIRFVDKLETNFLLKDRQVKRHGIKPRLIFNDYTYLKIPMELPVYAHFFWIVFYCGIVKLYDNRLISGLLPDISLNLPAVDYRLSTQKNADAFIRVDVFYKLFFLYKNNHRYDHTQNDFKVERSEFENGKAEASESGGIE